MRLTSSLLLLPLLSSPVLACPSYDVGCINRENSYRYSQQSQEWAYREQQKMQQWQTQNQLRHMQDQMTHMNHQYGHRIGSPYRPF